MRQYRRHVRVYAFFRWLLSPWLRRKFNFMPEVCRQSGPILVMANHNTDWDPMLTSLSFPEHMYFVASEHIFRKSFLSKLLMFFLAPIARLKGGTAADTAKSIMRSLKKGRSVCLFVEGAKSFDGLTCPIAPSAGKLARAAGATLVTYKLEGGYFTSPRWGKGIRRGAMRGYPVNTYTKQQMREMAATELSERIAADLFEDAYQRQRESPVRFRGKRPAEHLETSLFLCPACGESGTLKSEGDRFFCVCGLETRYTDYGFLEGGAPFSTITEWDAWQAKELEALARRDSAGPLLGDTELVLTEVFPGYRSAVLGRGSARIYPDRFELPGITLQVKDISGADIHGRQCLVFSTAEKRYFELDSPKVRCLRKYMQMIHILKG